nr:PREDICTED: uncharacterized protein LOC106484924 [Apteryx mantelli mantelli]
MWTLPITPINVPGLLQWLVKNPIQAPRRRTVPTLPSVTISSPGLPMPPWEGLGAQGPQRECHLARAMEIQFLKQEKKIGGEYSNGASQHLFVLWGLEEAGSLSYAQTTRQGAALTRSWAGLAPKQAPWLWAHRVHHTGEAPEGHVPPEDVASTVSKPRLASSWSLVSYHFVRFAPLLHAWFIACPILHIPCGVSAQEPRPTASQWGHRRPGGTHVSPVLSILSPFIHVRAKFPLQLRARQTAFLWRTSDTVPQPRAPLTSLLETPSTDPTRGWLHAVPRHTGTRLEARSPCCPSVGAVRPLPG